MLIVAPWKSAFWDRNFFIERFSVLEALLSNVFVRGAVSGIGGLTTLAGLAELAGLFLRADREPGSAPGSLETPLGKGTGDKG